MSTKTVADNQSQALQSKLNAAIASRVSLEEDFEAQSSMLIEFINKLSQVSKGINVKLDNRFAQLRGLLTKSVPISDIELKINEIAKLLQINTETNEQNIVHLFKQFNEAGQNLQKANGLPNDVRRKLRGLLGETQSTKDSLAQYIPRLSQLLEFYNIALHSKADMPNNGLLTAIQQPAQANIAAEDKSSAVNSALIEQISSCLDKLHLSTQHTKELLAINKKLLKDTTNDDVLQHFIEIFDVIVADLQSERDSAKNFLNTLSKTLTTVQNAVKKTLSTCLEIINFGLCLAKKVKKKVINSI